MFFESMHPSWQALLADQRGLLQEIERQVPRDVLPPHELVMAAFARPVGEVRVAIIGQDPYPTPGDAIGLAFAIAPGRLLPRSLRNIMLELATDAEQNPSEFMRPPSVGGDLARWQYQGVLLLNRELTLPGYQGWREFTQIVIERLNRQLGGKLILILWGATAQQLKPLVEPGRAICSAHPSPLSARRGFFGSRPFSGVNRILTSDGQPKIDWSC